MAMSKGNMKKDGVVQPVPGVAGLEAALEAAKNQAEPTVRLIALTMKPINKIQIPVATGYVVEEVAPLGRTPKVTDEWADRMTAPKALNSRAVRPAIVWHKEPPVRPKSAKRQSFVKDGRTFYTDTFAPDAGFMVNGRAIYHSVSQSMNFITHVLRTIPGIQRWITEFDTRPEVAQWGNYEIMRRTAEANENLGLANNDSVVS